ncbi:hypothetical protein FACS189493_4360 [Spirochaetia bacterium]|nr:hypothetical protein FACS189493_4360 [Spirochaetia bacterium]
MKRQLKILSFGLLLFLTTIPSAFVLYILLKISMDYNTSNNHIWEICTFVVISIFQLIASHGWRYINAVRARFMLDSMYGRQMEIEAELNNGNISKEDAENKKYELGKELDLYGNVDGYSGLFLRISKIITIILVCIAIIFLTINGLKIFIIDNKYIMAIIIYGIVLEFIFSIIQLYASIIPRSKLRGMFNQLHAGP